MFEGFARERVRTSEAEIALMRGGSGPPLLLLHGYPQNKTMWHRVAPGLAAHFTVVIPDLRGYGDSSHPADAADHRAYSKRAMAVDQVETMERLGFGSFFVAGHDRGGRVAYRLALDHPARVARLATLDIVPTYEQFSKVDRHAAMGGYHWYFLAQPRGFPERLIGADPEFFLRHTMGHPAGRRDAGAGATRFTDEAFAEYLRCFQNPAVIHATCEDYRAGATIDFDLDAADLAAGRRIQCPMLALWGERGRRRDVLETWKKWANDVRGRALACGHFLPEEAPDETLAEMTEFFLDRGGRPASNP
jgi:haloacetate dehalogenase